MVSVVHIFCKDTTNILNNQGKREKSLIFHDLLHLIYIIVEASTPCKSGDGSLIYSDEQSKFIIHPNYQMKVNREVVKLVNFITATRRTDKKEFNGKRYVKIE